MAEPLQQASRFDPEAIEDLVASCRGSLIESGDHDYDRVRAVYNAMIDRRPRLICRCHDVADVISAIRFGRENGVEVAVRAGAHSGAVSARSMTAS